MIILSQMSFYRAACNADAV